MKKLNYTLALMLTITSISLSSCMNDSHEKLSTKVKSSVRKTNHAASIKVDKNLSSFYAVCFEEHFGWCSKEFKTYAEAQVALDKHKADTGHTDNTISNNCEANQTASTNSWEEVELFKNTLDAKSLELLNQSQEKLINPLYTNGMHFDSLSLDEKKELRLLGGGAEVKGANQVVSLGRSTAGTSITVNVGGPATVRIGMWFLLAGTAAGQWEVSGPGSKTFQLNCNVLHTSPNGCPIYFGQAVNISAEGINGTYPVWVSFN